MRQQAVQTGHADVIEAPGGNAVGVQGQRALVGNRTVGGPCGGDQHRGVAGGGRRAVQQAAGGGESRADRRLDGLHLVAGDAGDENRPVAVRQQLGDDPGALLGCLARAEHCFGHALAQGPVVVDEGVADVGERQPAQPDDHLIGADPSGREVVEHLPQRRLLHPAIVRNPAEERPMGVQGSVPSPKHPSVGAVGAP